MDDVAATEWLEALPDAALVVNATGVVNASNALAREALQLNPHQIPVTQIIRSEEIAASLASLRQLHEQLTVDFMLPGLVPRYFGVSLSLLGSDGHVLIIMRDLTREQAIEKMRSDFVANASHEMRTPLTSIMGAIETLQGPAKNDTKAREMFLATMLVQSQRMKRLVDDLLTLSRIELREHLRPDGKVSLPSVINQARSNLSSVAAAEKVVVDVEVAEDFVVAGDFDELLQVTQNLIENALKYGSKGGRVIMRCTRENGHAVLAVQDFGDGIPEIHLPRLTERFYRVSTKESRARGGTGLGLAIVKHIVLRHRGKLDIASEVGRGSTFSISIPLYNSTR